MWKVLKCRKKVGGRKYAEIMQIALCFETVENLKNIYTFNDTIFTIKWIKFYARNYLKLRFVDKIEQILAYIILLKINIDFWAN